ncbi:MAG: hypothetical protein DWQ06_03130 [Calditrichaeota bacterium]|nr:MAG: hypothetical protein DWQ06_03130 [Calditrichota bacterium]
MRAIILVLTIFCLYSCFGDDMDIKIDKNESIFPSPDSLQTSQISDSKVQLSWQFSKDVEILKKLQGFKIEKKINEENSIEIIFVNADSTSFIDSGLSTSKIYSYRVSAFAKNDSSYYSQSSNVQTNFPVPTNLEILQISDSKVNLSWLDNCEFESGYKIERKEINNTYEELAILPFNSTSYLDSTLSETQTYNYRVRAFSQINNSTYSNEAHINTGFSAPTNLEIAQVTDSEANLNWQDNSSFEEGFTIERKVNNGNFSAIHSTSSGSTNFKDSGLLISNNYTYRVKAFTNSTYSAYTQEKSIQTNFPAPSNLEIIQYTGSEVTLTWQDNSTFENGFIIERKEENGNFTEVHSTLPNSTNFTDNGLLPTKEYRYRVKAFSNFNVSSYTQEKSIQTNFPAPTNFKMQIISNSELELTWESNYSFDVEYKIERQINNGNFQELAILPSNSVSFIDTDIFTWLNYTYKLTAFTNSNNSNVALLKVRYGLEGTTVWTANHSDKVLTVQFSTDGNKIISGSEDKTIKVWDSIDGSLQWTGLHSQRVSSIASNQNGSQVASGSQGKLNIWNLQTGSLIWSYDASGFVTQIKYSPTDNQVAMVGNGLKIFNAFDGTILHNFGGSTSLDFSNDGQKIAGAQNPYLYLSSLEGDSIIWRSNHPDIHPIRFSPDGSKLISGSYQDNIKVWDIATGSVLLTGYHSGYVLSVDFSFDSKLAVSGGESPYVKVWDVENASEKWSKTHSGTTRKVIFSPDGTKVLSIAGKTLKIWDSSNGQLLWEGTHSEAIWSFDISPDGSKVIIGDYNNSINLWQLNWEWREVEIE